MQTLQLTQDEVRLIQAISSRILQHSVEYETGRYETTGNLLMSYGEEDRQLLVRLSQIGEYGE